jgi:hypothetical protein
LVALFLEIRSRFGTKSTLLTKSKWPEQIVGTQVLIKVGAPGTRSEDGNCQRSACRPVKPKRVGGS